MSHRQRIYSTSTRRSLRRGWRHPVDDRIQFTRLNGEVLYVDRDERVGLIVGTITSEEAWEGVYILGPGLALWLIRPLMGNPPRGLPCSYSLREEIKATLFGDDEEWVAGLEPSDWYFAHRPILSGEQMPSAGEAVRKHPQSCGHTGHVEEFA